MKPSLKATLYRAVDACMLGRGVPRTICGETVRFPARFSRYYASDYEPNTFVFLRRHCRRGATAMDLGAHLGLFSIAMARVVGPEGRVFAFEPTPATREALSEVVRLNGCEKVVSVQGEAVSGKRGEATFYDTGEIASNANSLVRTEFGKNGITVETVSLDEFVAERHLQPCCLKVDVEGAELDMLHGARKTLRKYRPAIALSLHPASFPNAAFALSEIWSLLNRFGFSLSLLEGYHRRPAEKPIDEGWFCCQKAVFDVAVVPSGP